MQYYKPCMRLNKVNLCWVLSDGRKGHEIQSLTLAERLANKHHAHQFVIQQPWETFTPRIIPGFQNGLKWHGQKPDFSLPPDLIITTGKKAAAAGKFIAQKLKKGATELKHIQILNPKDNHAYYDLLLIPDHDQKTGLNIINYPGSLHPFSPQWFKHSKQNLIQNLPSLGIILGSPPTKYFNQSFKAELQKIRNLYPDQAIQLCGSPRLSNKQIIKIKAVLTSKDMFWYKDQNDTNPYQALLQQSKHLFVTADSINMMNECASTDIPVTLLAKQHITSKKHHRFIESMAPRWQGFVSHNDELIQPIPYVLDVMLANPRFQKLLNSPCSSKSG